MIITRNSEARVVVQDIESCERTEETPALIEILALGNRQVERGKITPARLALKKVHERRKRRLFRGQDRVAGDHRAAGAPLSSPSRSGVDSAA